MSMYTICNNEYYHIPTPVPAWKKNERYEYCEPFSLHTGDKPRRHGFSFFHSLLGMILHTS